MCSGHFNPLAAEGRGISIDESLEDFTVIMLFLGSLILGTLVYLF
jgi:hypothetical protein